MARIKIDFMKRGKLIILGEGSVARKCSDLLNSWLWWSYVGRAILEEIFEAPQGKQVRISIVPKNLITAKEAEATPDDVEDAYAKGYQTAGGLVAGTGQGTSAEIKLTESLTVSDGVCNAIMHVPCSSLAPFKTQFVLMHELVHANRMLRGMMRKYGVGDRLGNSEEAMAIIVTNMLMSEKGESQLRKSYDTADVLTGTAKDFLQRPGMESLVRNLAADHPKLKAAVNAKDAPVPFNPVFEAFQGSP